MSFCFAMEMDIVLHAPLELRICYLFILHFLFYQTLSSQKRTMEVGRSQAGRMSPSVWDGKG